MERSLERRPHFFQLTGKHFRHRLSKVRWRVVVHNGAPVVSEIVELATGEVVALPFYPIVEVASGRSVLLRYLSLQNLTAKRFSYNCSSRGTLPVGQRGDLGVVADAGSQRSASLEGSAYKFLCVLRERFDHSG